MFPRSGRFLQVGLGVPGHRPPLCSAIRNRTRPSLASAATLPTVGQRRHIMTRIRAIALATLLTLTLTLAVAAQQANAGRGGPAKGSPGGDHAVVPAADVQLKFLS